MVIKTSSEWLVKILITIWHVMPLMKLKLVNPHTHICTVLSPFFMLQYEIEEVV